MMRPDPKVKAVYLYPKPVDFRKSINGLVALVELDIKVAVFDPVLFVFLNRTRNQVKILYWHRNGFCLWLKRLEAERFKTKPATCPSTITPPNARSGPSSSATRTGYSATRPRARPPAPSSTAWWKPPRPTARSPTPTCATSSSASPRPRPSRTTKRCCRGAVHQPSHTDSQPSHKRTGVYGALTDKRPSP